MSANPPFPRPPVPPQPPRPGSKVVPIVLLVLALIILVCGLGVWTGLKFLSHNVRIQVAGHGTGKEDVSVNTPVGSVEVRRDVREGSLDLPLYPGATQVVDKDSASVNLDFGDEANVRVRAAKFETADPLEKVKAFYKERLGVEVARFIEKDAGGKTAFEMKSDKQEKVVELKWESGRTSIELVQVSFGKSESN